MPSRMGTTVCFAKTIRWSAESGKIWAHLKKKGYSINTYGKGIKELKTIMAVDLSGYPNGYEQARDIFMIGVWTAQRVSDYNYIKKEDFSTLTKNVMKEKPDALAPRSCILPAWICTTS